MTRPVPAAQARPGAGPLVSRARSGSTGGCCDPGRERLPAADGPAGPGHPLPGRAGPVGDPRLSTPGGCTLDVTAEVPVAQLTPTGRGPDPARTAGVDLGIIHPYAVAGPEGQGLLVSGRAIRAECRQHLRDRKGRTRAAAARAPKPGQRGSRRWRKHRQRASGRPRPGTAGGSGRPSTRPPSSVITWAVEQPDRHPRGRRPPRRAAPEGRAPAQPADPGLAGRAPDPASCRDKAQAAGITVQAGRRAGHVLDLPRLRPAGSQARRAVLHAARTAGRAGTATSSRPPASPPGHPAAAPSPLSRTGRGSRTAAPGAHLPGVHPARRDPRRRPSSRPARRGHLASTGPPRTPSPDARHTGSRSRQREEPASTPGQPRRTYRHLHNRLVGAAHRGQATERAAADGQSPRLSPYAE